MIPKNIFQTHKSLDYINSKPKVAKAISSWIKGKQQNFKYYFFTDKMCDTFMKTYYNGKVYEAYQRLPMAVMKADLWRYCVIHKYGGIYADSDTICKVNPNLFISDSLMMIVPENDGDYLCQWVFSAQKGCPILKSIIDLSVERILGMDEIKGEHIIHYLTGPSVFTDGIEKYLKENDKPVFNDKKKYVFYPDPILKVFSPDIFHKNIVQHLFTGDDNDGWKKERFVKLKI